jgi:hypothetical protein
VHVNHAFEIILGVLMKVGGGIANKAKRSFLAHHDNAYLLDTYFEQAQTIGVRYMELWEYEFVNNTFPQEFESFNEYANTNFE